MYDVIFIGSGRASWHGAATLAQAGKKVAIVEKDLTGGTCTNCGRQTACIWAWSSCSEPWASNTSRARAPSPTPIPSG